MVLKCVYQSGANRFPKTKTSIKTSSRKLQNVIFVFFYLEYRKWISNSIFLFMREIDKSLFRCRARFHVPLEILTKTRTALYIPCPKQRTKFAKNKYNVIPFSFLKLFFNMEKQKTKLKTTIKSFCARKTVGPFIQAYFLCYLFCPI